MLRLDDRIWILWAIWILIFPLTWIISFFLAVVVHELFHVAAIYLVGGKVKGISVLPAGVLLEAEGIEGGREILCALAGPCGSFLLVFLARVSPGLALCGFVQGVFNLLPVYPLDGGRALRSILYCISAEKGERIADFLEFAFLSALVCSITVLSLRYRLGFFPFVICVFVIASAIQRKRLEKEAKSGYNSATI